MSKFIKYTQLESGPFTKSNNRCQIIFDANGITNMRDSYLDITCRFKDSNGAYVKHNRVYLGDHDSQCHYSPSALIKHMTLTTEASGILEENRFINRFNQTMQQYTMTSEELQSMQIFAYASTELEDNDDAHLMIPLKEVLGCGSVNNYPNQRLGKSTLKIEFEDVVNVAYINGKPFYQFNDIGLANVDNSADANPLDVSQITTTSTFADKDTFESLFEIGDTVHVFNQATTIDYTPSIMDRTYDASNKTGSITLSASFTVPANTDEATLGVSTTGTPYASFNNINNTMSITQITYANTDKSFSTNISYYIAFKNGTEYYMVHQAPSKVDVAGGNTTLTFSKPIFTATANTNVVEIQVMAQPEAVDYEVSDIELVLNKPDKFTVPKSMAYSTWQVESVNQPTTTDYRRQFEVQPNCTKLYLMTPTTRLVSQTDSMESYRASINGFDTTNRDVGVYPNSPLYQDKLISTIPSLRALNPNNGKLDILTVPEQMPMTGQENVMQIRAKYSAACTAKVIYLFKVLTRSV